MENDFESANIVLCPIELYAVSALFRVPINHAYSTMTISFVLLLEWQRSCAAHRLQYILLRWWAQRALDHGNFRHPSDGCDCRDGSGPPSSACPDFEDSLRDSRSIAPCRPNVSGTENMQREFVWGFREDWLCGLPPSIPFRVWCGHRPSWLCVCSMHEPHCPLWFGDLEPHSGAPHQRSHEVWSGTEYGIYPDISNIRSDSNRFLSAFFTSIQSLFGKVFPAFFWRLSKPGNWRKTINRRFTIGKHWLNSSKYRVAPGRNRVTVDLLFSEQLIVSMP